MPDRKSILQVIGISKSYGRRAVLKDVTFEMRPGEIVGIVGENGSGKSTLLKILMGLLSPGAGNVSLRGGIGYCPQEASVFEALTVRENFQYFAAAYGLPGIRMTNSWEKAKNDLLDRFQFGQYESSLVSHLSGGTKQKLNLSLALLHAPDILILDEPYSGFDWETYLRFWAFAGEMQLDGKSILVVSHLVNDRSKFTKLYDLKEGLLECV